MIPGGCSDSGGPVQGRAEEAIVEKRRSIDVAGARHVNPIPSASRKGPFVASGAISGADPATGKVPEDLDAQCAAMFANVRRVIETAGGTPDDIIKITPLGKPEALVK